MSRAAFRSSALSLPDAAVQEPERSALRCVFGFKFPGTRVVAALAPANLKKAGPAYDLRSGTTIIATGQAPLKRTGNPAGELGLDGTLRHTRFLPMCCSHENGFSAS